MLVVTASYCHAHVRPSCLPASLQYCRDTCWLLAETKNIYVSSRAKWNTALHTHRHGRTGSAFRTGLVRRTRWQLVGNQTGLARRTLWWLSGNWTGLARRTLRRLSGNRTGLVSWTLWLLFGNRTIPARRTRWLLLGNNRITPSIQI